MLSRVQSAAPLPGQLRPSDRRAQTRQTNGLDRGTGFSGRRDSGQSSSRILRDAFAFHKTTALVVWSVFITSVLQSIGNPLPAQQINSITEPKSLPVTVTAGDASRWKQGDYDVWHLKSGLTISQGRTTLRAERAIVWLEKEDPTRQIPAKLIVYAEGQRDADDDAATPKPSPNASSSPEVDSEKETSAVRPMVTLSITRSGQAHSATGRPVDQLTSTSWLGRFYSDFGVQFNVPIIGKPPSKRPAIFERALQARESESHDRASLAQYQTERPNAGSSDSPGANSATARQLDEVPTSLTQNGPVYGSAISGSATGGSATGRPAMNGPANQQSNPSLPYSNQGNSTSSLPVQALPQGAPRIQSAPGSVASPTQIEFKPRSRNPLNIRSFPSPDGSENIFLYTGGVRVTIAGQEIGQFQQALGTGGPANNTIPSSNRITIEADTVVAWTNPLRQLVGNRLDDSAKRWEVYLEGNVVFSTDDRVVYAERMYYDVQQKRGTILDAELYSPVPGYEGMLRLKADVLQQIDENNVRAYGTAVTSSRIGVPRYWLQSEVLDLNRQPRFRYNEFGQIQYDLQTGQPETAWAYEGTSRNNFVYVLGLPVFFWPTLNGNSDQGSYYLSGLAIKNDQVFGFQTYTRFNAFQLFGVRQPDNVDWDVNLDYLSDRGFGFGTEADYDLVDPYGFRKMNQGRVEAWGIFDDGLDNLGRDRRRLVPEKDFRGRLFWQHRSRRASGLELTAELGWISDRNFLEQYREREWDQNKDQLTGLQLKQLWGEQSINVNANFRTNDFFTQTNRLPAVDYFVLGRSLLNQRLTYTGHFHAGYNKLEVADTPTDPTDAAKFDPLAWEIPREGLTFGSRSEIAMPLQAGVTKVTPYLLSESIFYGEEIDGSTYNRSYGQAGVRLSLPMVSVNPNVQDVLFNLNGLAHKVEWEADLMFAEADQDLDRLPLYNPLDDDAQEHFRRRFFFDSFGGAPGGNVPLRYDERNFAFRSGMQSRVTAASPEIVDDMMAARFGVNQRWQTKRGPAGNQRIVDWIVFDLHSTLFAKDTRDNFGESLGVVDYNFRWHVGDRLTVLSDAYADFFSQGLRTISIGTRMTRPEIGNLYVGFRSIEGPISANVLNTQLNHRLTDKWAMTLGTSIDFGKSGNLGQRFAVSRIGESAILRAGVNVDVSRGTTGVNFLIIPRFIPRQSLRRTIGIDLPPLGARGIE